MKRKRWTYKGIKRYWPPLTFEGWLAICKQGQQHCRSAELVLSGFIGNQPGASGKP